MTLARFASLALIAAAAALPAAAQEAEPRTYAGYRAVRVQVRSAGESLAVAALAPDGLECEIQPGQRDVLVAPERWEAFQQLHLPTEVIAPDAQAWFAQERATPPASAGGFSPREEAWFTAYKTLAEIEAKHAAIASQFPTLVTRTAIGTSLEGRTLYALRVSAPDSAANPRNRRLQIVINANQHAREWITPMTAMWAFDQLTSRYGTDARITGAMDRIEFLIVPCTNPDGYTYSWSNDRLWRKNKRQVSGVLRGVDLNRNWASFWGLDNSGSSPNPNDETYRGTAAFSEPESAALRNFILTLPRIVAHIDVHSYGRLLLHAPGWTPQTARYNAQYGALTNALAAAISGVNNSPHVGGPASTTLYLVNGGAADWSHIDRRAWSYVWELRLNSFVLPPEQIIPTGREIFEGFLTLSEAFTSCILPLDFNRDGSVSPQDVDDYFSVLGDGPCSTEASFGCGSLDFNRDGSISPTDVDAYFVALGEGGC